MIPPLELENNLFLWLATVNQYKIRDTFCSYSVMELCTKGLGNQVEVLKVRSRHKCDVLRLGRASLRHRPDQPQSILATDPTPATPIDPIIATATATAIATEQASHSPHLEILD